MTRSTDTPTADSAPARPAPGRAPPRPPCALLLDVEPATSELMALWLGAEGWQLRSDPTAPEPVALIVVELAYPRHDDRQRLRALAEDWPGVPVIVLSPTFFADVPARGEVARQLGVFAVLATPVARTALVAVVRAAQQGRT